jgi:hypothetical protein
MDMLGTMRFSPPCWNKVGALDRIEAIEIATTRRGYHFMSANEL